MTTQTKTTVADVNAITITHASIAEVQLFVNTVTSIASRIVRDKDSIPFVFTQMTAKELIRFMETDSAKLYCNSLSEPELTALSMIYYRLEDIVDMDSLTEFESSEGQALQLTFETLKGFIFDLDTLKP